LPTERNLLTPSNCRSRFPFPTDLLTIYAIRLSQKGADAFYTGQIAENIVSCKLLLICFFPRTCCTEEVVHLISNRRTRRDHNLTGPQRLQTITRTPVNITYRGNRIFSTVAPSSGAVVLSALKIFEGYPATAKVDDPEYDLTAHRLIQATRFGYGQRTNYGDPAYTANVSALERLSDRRNWRFFGFMLISPAI